MTDEQINVLRSLIDAAVTTAVGHQIPYVFVHVHPTNGDLGVASNIKEIEMLPKLLNAAAEVVQEQPVRLLHRQ